MRHIFSSDYIPINNALSPTDTEWQYLNNLLELFMPDDE
jgi:hypothetical protein